MKFLTLVIVFSIVGCGKDPGSAGSQSSNLLSDQACSKSPIIGKWRSQNTSKIIEFTASCKYNNVYCKSQGSFPATTTTYNEGVAKITVDMKSADAPSIWKPGGAILIRRERLIKLI